MRRRSGRTTTQRGLGYAWRQRCVEAFKVHGDICHLCGLPGADTIDHLEPRKFAGARIPSVDRLRPAHRKCNSSRGAKPIEQVQRRVQSRNW